MEDQIFDKNFFDKLNTLKLSMNLRLNQGMGGGRKSNAKGTSVEFSDFREYMLGDDIRRIDWNAYGRMNKLYIKQYMEEKEGLFHIFLDTSKSMLFGEASKSRTCLQIAGALSYIILNNLDRVFINRMEEKSLVQGKGNSGRVSLQKILTDLTGITFDGKTSLNESIMSRPVKGGGVSVLLSDFLDPDGIEEAVKYLLYQKQEVVLIQILSREEMDISIEGTVNLLDLETEENMKITITKKTIEQYQQNLRQLEDNLNRLSKKYGTTYIQAVSDQPIDQILFEGFKKNSFILSRG